MDKNKLRQVIIDQQLLFNKADGLVDRDIKIEQYLKGNEIIIISGIRRCGKSSLLKLISQKLDGEKVYINFDDIRLVDFNVDNFSDIADILTELYEDTSDIIYFLDEIQNVPHWERWLNNLYGQGAKVFVTGSNSHLLSSEISTYLTGRNKVIRLFPFSFREYLRLESEDKTVPSYQKLPLLPSGEKALLYRHFLQYFEKGGFPLVLINDDLELSANYFEDILNKDILNRYRIKEQKSLKDLILFLFSNVGNVYSYSTLKTVSGIKSLSTIKNYVDYFQNVFLLYQVQRFDYSLKKQAVSSSKIYSIDNSFLKTVAFNFSENKGSRLENLVFIHLKRMEKDVYYHSDKKECDFVIKDRLAISETIQVSLELTDPVTRKREINGLMEAMKQYKLNKGLILTLEEEEDLTVEGLSIKVKPVWKWLLEN
ncbi:ATP-binding protein [Methanococcoides sp. NM1]|uniref:ATP-binding protein n=1 Tax=Methanococcoides sp. NM1 TaxID=1201013 RepID=UPI0010825F03|nr:ATP-binding protein [Methanococcoides sp. NM1]